jgi:hypothetical protein
MPAYITNEQLASIASLDDEQRGNILALAEAILCDIAVDLAEDPRWSRHYRSVAAEVKSARSYAYPKRTGA